jgi:inositol-hexakisphosphate kinase
MSLLPINTQCPLRRSCQIHHRHRLRLYENESVEVNNQENEGENEDVCASFSKRLKVKTDPSTNVSSGQLSSTVDDSTVDVRMIDFAHTTFGYNQPAVVAKAATSTVPSNLAIHQGPDCGFLTGLDSLKRLLLEILAEEA